MDLNDIWQEHKVWILGVLAGVVVFLVANGLISSNYDTGAFERTISTSKNQLKRTAFYGVEQRNEAAKDKKAVAARLADLEARTYFQVRGRFDLDGKGDATLHYLATTTEIKNRVQEAMDAASVDFSQLQLGLPANSPTEREETQKMLIGLDLIEDVLDRLLLASDEVTSENNDAQGLRALDQIQIDTGGKGRLTRSSGPWSRRKKKVDLGDRVSVKIRFHADAITLQVFLESLLAPGKRPLLLEDIVATNTDRPGEPMSITCRFLALLKREA